VEVLRPAGAWVRVPGEAGGDLEQGIAPTSHCPLRVLAFADAGEAGSHEIVTKHTPAPSAWWMIAPRTARSFASQVRRVIALSAARACEGRPFTWGSL
jgi:hypothetical protein